MSERTQPTVLVVDDEPTVIELYRTWLGDRYTLIRTTGGEAALDELSPDVDVILLDRQMPGLSGDEVLDRIRRRGNRTPVAMVTGVKPTVDIIDMGFDEYIVKPFREAEVIELVERLLCRGAYDERMRTFFALASKKALLEANMSQSERRTDDRYAALREAVAVAGEQATKSRESVLDADGYAELFRRMSRFGDDAR
jgi:two-component system response regulator AdeR